MFLELLYQVSGSATVIIGESSYLTLLDLSQMPLHGIFSVSPKIYGKIQFEDSTS